MKDELFREEQVFNLFKKLSLKNLDAKIYLTLLSKGPLTISQLVEELGIYRPQLHNSLSRLLAKGFVEASKRKPTIYRAVNPQVVVDTFKAEMLKLGDEAIRYMRNLRHSREDIEHGIWLLRSHMGL